MSPGTPSSVRTSRRRILRRSLVAVAAVPGALLCSPVAAQASGPPALTCSAVSLPVAIADPGPADQTLWGQLCYRGQDEPGTVQILIPGGTYTHLYWDSRTETATTTTSAPPLVPATRHLMSTPSGRAAVHTQRAPRSP